MSLDPIISFAGLICMLLISWGLSENRRAFPWRTVLWAVGLQFIFAVIILKTGPGLAAFEAAQNAVNKISQFALEAAQTVFGPLANINLLSDKLGPENAFIFAVVVSATIIVISALSSLLYHWRILQWVMQGTAWVMKKTLGTSGSESLAAAANIFMGQTEAPLVIKPYLPTMTRSELLAVMLTGMASISGSVLAAYVSMGISAGHMIAASVMSAPAALAISKILLPEREISATSHGHIKTVEIKHANAIDAISSGATEGLMLSLNVIAMLIALLALVALANFLLVQGQAAAGLTRPMDMQTLVGYLNAPIAWILGVPSQDCFAVGKVLGERIILNEFIAYIDLGQLKPQLTERGFTLATYALCGFANIGSIAVQIGGIGSLAPERRGDIARLGFKAMIGGVISCYMTAAIVGMLI